jgi:hypothetical protein
MSLRFTYSPLFTYPDGTTQGINFFVDGKCVGTAQTVEGGYLVAGKRKPVATPHEAAKQLLDRAMSDCMNEHTRLHRLLRAVLDERAAS